MNNTIRALQRLMKIGKVTIDDVYLTAGEYQYLLATHLSLEVMLNDAADLLYERYLEDKIRAELKARLDKKDV